jgi:glucokinase
VSRLALVADIGGTHARFALVETGVAPLHCLHAKTFRNVDFASLAEAAGHYLALVGQHPRRATFAVAAPVRCERVHLTNRAWSFSRSRLREALGLEELLLVNDFGAVARAVPELAAGDHVQLHGPARSSIEGPASVLGPGTGLGVALLLGGAARGWQVVETEGGHASFAPQDEEERAIARWLATRYGRASNERVLSGQGLAEVDAVLRGAAPGETAALRDPGVVVDAALGHDDTAARALGRFCAVLGSVAGDIALVHGARTVMIAGGMVPRFLDVLPASPFLGRFLDKGRFAAHLASVAVHVVTHPYPGLLGAAVAMRDAAADR